MNPLFTYAVHRFLNPRRHWHPFISVFYLTYECDFRCPFCSDGSGTPYHRLSREILPAAQVIRLLKIIRRTCEYLVITGGEPLNHPEFSRIMAEVGTMGFREVILTTNGYNLGKHLPAIAGSVTSLVFSLNSLDPERAETWFGIPASHADRGDAGNAENAGGSSPGKAARLPGSTLKKILANIDLADRYPGKSWRIHVSSVVAPGNIDDLYRVYGFSRERDFIFAACPQLVGVKAHAALDGNPAFRGFYDFLIAEKRRGNPVYGSIPYLERMRDLRRFRCRPFTMLVVSPTGDVFYPCLEIGHRVGNLLQTSDLHWLRREGERRFGPQPVCDARCQSACALGFATMFDHPLAAVEDAWLTITGNLRRGRARAARSER